jgi:hypothetical protein
MLPDEQSPWRIAASYSELKDSVSDSGSDCEDRWWLYADSNLLQASLGESSEDFPKDEAIKCSRDGFTVCLHTQSPEAFIGFRIERHKFETDRLHLLGQQSSA